MLSIPVLHDFLKISATHSSTKTAVIEPGFGEMSYGDLDRLSGRLRDRLVHLGVRPGDRVGVYLPKTIDSVASIFGILRSGAAYVPVDTYAPQARCAFIFTDCTVKVVIVTRELVEGLLKEIPQGTPVPELIVLESVGGGMGLGRALDDHQNLSPAPEAEDVSPPSTSLAYILYTSGSTGKPKGVKLSHEAAISFVDWCSETFHPVEGDRFSSHAPFHFDLSILDIYLPIKHGSTLILIDEPTGKDPQKLADLIAEHQISSWYSTPSILTFLYQYGKLERYDYSSLRTVLFAGEVFPVKHLRKLKELIPHPRYFNLYGPTETNVCTYFEIPDVIPADRTQPYPIGRTCSHLSAKVVGQTGEEVPFGEEGELVVSGPGVMDGYWNLPDRTSQAFLNGEDGELWYKTGDIVREEPTGDYIYLSRRDRMVKKRGYRVELGEIEAGLYKHPAVVEAAVVALQDSDGGVKIKAFVQCRADTQPSIIEMKQFCHEHLPSYMAPDIFSFQEQLPKTSTHKIDYQKLLAL
jgi:amino acid adenylation domain-containing protein